MSTVCLHENARIDQLCDRRNIVLLCIMFDLCQKGLYMKKSVRFTCATDGYNFDLAILCLGLYVKSAYYMGASMWNGQPVNIQNINKKERFKCKIRSRLNHL